MRERKEMRNKQVKLFQRYPLQTGQFTSGAPYSFRVSLYVSNAGIDSSPHFQHLGVACWRTDPGGWLALDKRDDNQKDEAAPSAGHGIFSGWFHNQVSSHVFMFSPTDLNTPTPTIGFHLVVDFSSHKHSKKKKEKKQAGVFVFIFFI